MTDDFIADNQNYQHSIAQMQQQKLLKSKLAPLVREIHKCPIYKLRLKTIQFLPPLVAEISENPKSHSHEGFYNDKSSKQYPTFYLCQDIYGHPYQPNSFT